MGEIDLRRLKRDELLEMLLEQSRESERLRGQVEALQKKLDDREIRLEKAGTIAEAAFELNGVLDAAQAAAAQYLDNLRQLSERQEVSCVQLEKESKEKSEKLLSETERICENKEKITADRCAAMEQAMQERCLLMKEEAVKSCNELKQTTQQECSAQRQETENDCAVLRRKTREECEAREREAEERCAALDKKAEQDVESRWDELSRRLEEFYRVHEGLRELLNASGGIQRE